MLLKTLVVPGSQTELLQSGQVLASEYFLRCDWEPQAALEARAAMLLPALLLARVDGKSPVEYLTDGPRKAFVRTVASALLRVPVPTLGDVLGTWQAALAKHMSTVPNRTDHHRNIADTEGPQ
jgi:hypothetical protein